MKINKNSWHYHIVKTYTDFDSSYRVGDICSYTRSLLLGLLNICLIILLGSSLLYVMVVDPLIWVFASKLDTSLLSDLSKAGICLWSLLLMVFLISGIGFCIEQNRMINIPKPDGFIKKAYKSWKDKFCIKLEFE